MLLDRDDVESLLDMAELIPVVEQAQVQYSRGRAVQPMRLGVRLPRYPGSLELMPGYLEESDALAVKVLTVRPENAGKGLPLVHATILLQDPSSGRLLAILDGASVTAARTAAVSGVATSYLARQDSSSLAIVGTGRQARTHLWAMTVVRPIRQIRAYDRQPEAARAFKDEMEGRFGLPVEITSTAEEAVRGADIVVLSTSTVEPVVQSGWVQPGMHFNSIASATTQVREMDSETIRMSKVVVDSREAALKEAGDILIPISEGLIGPDHIYAEVGEIAAGARPGREDDREVTVYKSLGLAIQDAAAAKLLYEKARRAGLGTEVAI